MFIILHFRKLSLYKENNILNPIQMTWHWSSCNSWENYSSRWLWFLNVFLRKLISVFLFISKHSWSTIEKQIIFFFNRISCWIHLNCWVILPYIFHTQSLFFVEFVWIRVRFQIVISDTIIWSANLNERDMIIWIIVINII